MNKFEIVSTYEGRGIKLPSRGTIGSAGYDFYAPETIKIPSHLEDFSKKEVNRITNAAKQVFVKPYIIKTGIKCKLDPGYVLQVYMRSSSPIKLGLVMANSVGIIDSDYYNNEENEGEIVFIVYNLSPDTIILEKGQKIGQGLIYKYEYVINDKFESKARTGGFGSTGN